MRLDRLIRKDLVPTIGIGNVDESNRDVQALQQATILLIKHKRMLCEIHGIGRSRSAQCFFTFIEVSSREACRVGR